MGTLLSTSRRTLNICVVVLLYHAYKVYKHEWPELDLLTFLNSSVFSISPFLSFLLKDLACLFVVVKFIRLLRRMQRVSLADLKNDIGTKLFEYASGLPVLSGRIKAELKKMELDIERKVKPEGPRERVYTMPREGRTKDQILSQMAELAKKESGTWKGGYCSGAVYHGREDHIELLNQAAALFSVSNPLHADLWPSVMKFEAEICSMTAGLLGGGSNSGSSEVCGSLTSGGTESIVLAARAHKAWAKATKGITKPEIIVGSTAHAAIEKACEMFDITIVRIKCDAPDYVLSPSAVARNLSSDTIMIYASAPCFPQGTIDPIQELSQLALSHNIGLHVDCCLGGFILPFALRRQPASFPKFDFSLPGVTSMSVDTHKYGYASKGTSVVLYRDKALRRYQYFCFPKWTGGLYVTPTIAGSRPGALSAACWASMMSLGEEGYAQAAHAILDTTQKIRRGVEDIRELKVLGDPRAMIVSFSTRTKKEASQAGIASLNVYKVGDAMSKKGWNLNSLQNPASVHICVTLLHVKQETSDRFLSDLTDVVRELSRSAAASSSSSSSSPAKEEEEGTAPIYGLASGMPAGPVTELLKTYTDVVLKV